jgi:hypothetical protein
LRLPSGGWDDVAAQSGSRAMLGIAIASEMPLSVTSVGGAPYSTRSGRDMTFGELGQPLHGPGPERRRVARNARFTSLFDARHATIQRRDQFFEFPYEVGYVHRHGCPPRRVASRLAAFHTSPHPSQRQ